MAHRPCPFRTEQAESDINFFNSVIPLREQLQHQGRLVKISSSYSTEMVISEYPLRFRLSNFVPPQNMKHGAVEGGESPSQTQDCRRLSSAWPFLTSNQNINHTDRINMRHELKQCGIIVLYKTQLGWGLEFKYQRYAQGTSFLVKWDPKNNFGTNFNPF